MIHPDHARAIITAACCAIAGDFIIRMVVATARCWPGCLNFD
jgi:hypothetical protein